MKLNFDNDLTWSDIMDLRVSFGNKFSNDVCGNNFIDMSMDEISGLIENNILKEIGGIWYIRTSKEIYKVLFDKDELKHLYSSNTNTIV